MYTLFIYFWNPLSGTKLKTKIQTLEQHNQSNMVPSKQLQQGARSDECGKCPSVKMRLSAKNHSTKKTLWAGTLSWHKIHVLVFHKSGIFFHFFSEPNQHLNVIFLIYRLTLKHPFDRYYFIFFTSKKTINIVFNLDFLIRAFLIFDEVFQRIDCLRSYWKIRVSSHVMTFSNKFDYSFNRYMMSEKMIIRLYFWFWVIFF